MLIVKECRLHTTVNLNQQKKFLLQIYCNTLLLNGDNTLVEACQQYHNTDYNVSFTWIENIFHDHMTLSFNQKSEPTISALKPMLQFLKKEVLSYDHRKFISTDV